MAESNENSSGSSLIDKATFVVNRVGISSAVIGYLLYKDWVFAKDLLANQTQMLLLQTQISTSLRQIAEALSK